MDLIKFLFLLSNLESGFSQKWTSSFWQFSYFKFVQMKFLNILRSRNRNFNTLEFWLINFQKISIYDHTDRSWIPNFRTPPWPRLYSLQNCLPMIFWLDRPHFSFWKRRKKFRILTYIKWKVQNYPYWEPVIILEELMGNLNSKIYKGCPATT